LIEKKSVAGVAASRAKAVDEAGYCPSRMRDVVVTRVQYSGPPRRSRNLEERLMVRFPGAYRALAAMSQRLLSPRSRMRRALLRRALVSGWAAFYRRDFELMLVRYGPDVEYEFNPGLQTLGLGGTFRGHEGMVEALDKLAEAWESMELVPAYILDLGGHVLLLGFNRSRARASEVRLEAEFAQLVTVREGLAVHDQAFFSWEEGLLAAGLDPDAIALPFKPKR
jgi:ketosteroid isomerase-like protein